MKLKPIIFSNNAVLQLSTAESWNPQLALSSFFEDFDLNSCRYLLREHFDQNSPDPVSGQTLCSEPHCIFHIHLIHLLEATYLLHLAAQKKARQQHSKNIWSGTPLGGTTLGGTTLGGTPLGGNPLGGTPPVKTAPEPIEYHETEAENGYSDLPTPELMASLEEFFDSLSPDTFKRSFFGILTAYAQTTFYTYGSPAEALYTLAKLKDLIASLALAQAPPKVASRPDAAQPDQQQFYYPGHLPSKTRINPMRYIHEFNRTRLTEDWNDILESLQYFALSNESGTDQGDGLDTLSLYHQFAGLIEACYTVYKLAGGRLTFVSNQE